MCWPRFDSEFVFNRLIDSDQGGDFKITAKGDFESHQSYVNNTNVLRTLIKSSDGAFEIIDFAPRFYQHRRYFKPTSLIRIVRPISGEPLVRVSCDPVKDYGKSRCSQTFGSNHISYRGLPSELRLTTNASVNMVSESQSFVLDKTYYFALTYGQPLEEDLAQTCEYFLDQTVSYWRKWIKHSHLPSNYQKEVIRSALVLKLHQFEDTGAIIASTTTSIPEAAGTVRNWDYRYCWLRDALFSLGALQRLNHFEELEGFVVYLRNIVAQVRDSKQRLQPVYSVTGKTDLKEFHLDHLAGYKGHKPVRIGNQAFEHLQHDVYGEMILAISRIFLDIRFQIEGQSPPTALIHDLLGYIEKFLASPDAGLWEFRGKSQLHTFTVLMHWAGATVAEEIGRKTGDSTLMKKAASLKDQADKIIKTQCWDPKREVFVQASGGSFLDASLLMLINFGYLGKDDPRAHRQIDLTLEELDAGSGLLHRYITQDDFGETTNAFTICSFWLCEALARVGRQGEAEELFERLLKFSSPLGLYSEDLDPKSGEQWGNFPQTYSHVGLINAAFSLSSDKGLPGMWEYGY
jgi:GH15 family glucan-1,4-alpha-glucosidase